MATVSCIGSTKVRGSRANALRPARSPSATCRKHGTTSTGANILPFFFWGENIKPKKPAIKLDTLALILFIGIAATGLLTTALPAFFAPAPISIVLTILAGSELLMFSLSEMTHSVWREKHLNLQTEILKTDQETLETLSIVKVAYERWQKDRSLVDLITVLEQQLEG
jgi:hypothetical protein